MGITLNIWLCSQHRLLSKQPVVDHIELNSVSNTEVNFFPFFFFHSSKRKVCSYYCGFSLNAMKDVARKFSASSLQIHCVIADNFFIIIILHNEVVFIFFFSLLVLFVHLFCILNFPQKHQRSSD